MVHKKAWARLFLTNVDGQAAAAQLWNATDAEGRNAMDIAVKQQHWCIRRLLLAAADEIFNGATGILDSLGPCEYNQQGNQVSAEDEFAK